MKSMKSMKSIIVAMNQQTHYLTFHHANKTRNKVSTKNRYQAKKTPEKTIAKKYNHEAAAAVQKPMAA